MGDLISAKDYVDARVEDLGHRLDLSSANLAQQITDTRAEITTLRAESAADHATVSQQISALSERVGQLHTADEVADKLMAARTAGRRDARAWLGLVAASVCALAAVLALLL